MKENALQRQGTLSILILNKTRWVTFLHGGGEGGGPAHSFPQLQQPLEDAQQAACYAPASLSPPFSSLQQIPESPLAGKPPAWSLEPRAMVHNFCCSSEHLKAGKFFLGYQDWLLARTESCRLRTIFPRKSDMQSKIMAASTRAPERSTLSWQ